MNERYNEQETYLDVYGTTQNGDSKLIEDVHITFWSDEHGHFQCETDIEEKAQDARLYINYDDVYKQIAEVLS